jgi:hypothetical protein
MQIQIATGFDAMNGIKFTFGFWPSVGETTFIGVFLRLLSLGPLAGRAEIDEISHAWSGLSTDAYLFTAKQATPFLPIGTRVSGKS